MHGVREKFEIFVRKNKNNRGSARFIWFLLKKKSVLVLYPNVTIYVSKSLRTIFKLKHLDIRYNRRSWPCGMFNPSPTLIS